MLFNTKIYNQSSELVFCHEGPEMMVTFGSPGEPKTGIFMVVCSIVGYEEYYSVEASVITGTLSVDYTTCFSDFLQPGWVTNTYTPPTPLNKHDSLNLLHVGNGDMIPVFYLHDV